MTREAKENYGSILSDLSCSDVLEEDDDERSVSSSAFSSDTSSVGPYCYESSSSRMGGVSLSMGIGIFWAFFALLFAFTDTTRSSVVQPTATTVAAELVSSTNPVTDQAKYFSQQIIDHDHPDTSGRFRQRYYENLNYWKGPGHPIFLILGGEGPLERILYPFVSEVLAERFGAATFNPEHRYFGETFPVQNFTTKDIRQQLTPKQAIQDYVYFVQIKRKELGCGSRGSPTYCPVMTVGGSYAGLLSLLLRKSYPDVIDMAYAASPCLFLFQHAISPYTYYEYITQVADRVSHGCSEAVRMVVAQVQTDLGSISHHEELMTKATDYGICSDLSTDISGSDLAREIIGYTSINFGSTLMDFYPPSPERQFFQGCSLLQDTDKPVPARVKAYIQMISGSNDCYAMNSTTDDDDDDDDLWGALCCYLVPMIGKSEESMWPPHAYNLKKDAEYCRQNFDIPMDSDYMEKEFALSDLTNVTRLVLTNGMNDGWYPTSYLDSFSDVVVLTMENGAHHSDLTHQLQADTPDVELVHNQIAQLVELWLRDIREE